ncbi:hypothetical protein FQN55_005110 [Onygenales sp. PD_40]|nr:hypothetical protein FQN55_005110 [Onygenales sp. PD_40]KAK2775361.1 hypothetical protein FQN53_003182 [Emmonsiellopsis sp. PD_33]
MLRQLTLLVLTAALAGAADPVASLSKRAEQKVTSPRTGDRITTGINLQIRWETTDSPDTIAIELRKGLSHNLTTVHTISTDTPNNGSYHWRSRDDRFLRALGYENLPEAPPSGCDYVIALREPQTATYSDYFTIINLNDDGLPQGVSCPGASETPKNEGGDGTNGPSPGGSKNDPDGSPATGGNVTTGALAGAVGGTAGGLIIIFTAVLLIGRQRNWFVRQQYVQELVAKTVMEMRPIPVDVKVPPEPEPHLVSPFRYRELNAEQVHQMPGHPAEQVHQMPGNPAER